MRLDLHLFFQIPEIFLVLLITIYLVKCS